jgi:hypothetical protein
VRSDISPPRSVIYDYADYLAHDPHGGVPAAPVNKLMPLPLSGGMWTLGGGAVSHYRAGRIRRHAACVSGVAGSVGHAGGASGAHGSKLPPRVVQCVASEGAVSCSRPVKAGVVSGQWAACCSTTAGNARVHRVRGVSWGVRSSVATFHEQSGHIPRTCPDGTMRRCGPHHVPCDTCAHALYSSLRVQACRVHPVVKCNSGPRSVKHHRRVGAACSG